VSAIKSSTSAIATAAALDEKPAVRTGDVRRKGRDAGSDSAVAGSEAVDRADSRHHRLEENIGSAEVVLTQANLAEIQRAAAAIKIEGERYPEQLWKTVGL